MDAPFYFSSSRFSHTFCLLSQFLLLFN